MKAKKKTAHDRASNSSYINTIDKKQPTHLNITSWKANGVSSPFNPKFQFTSAAEVGKNCGKNDLRESVGVFQVGTQEGMGISSLYREEVQHREGDDQPLVADFHQQHKSRGGEEVSLGGNSPNIALADVVYSESVGNGDTVRMEFEGGSESPTSN